MNSRESVPTHEIGYLFFKMGANPWILNLRVGTNSIVNYSFNSDLLFVVLLSDLYRIKQEPMGPYETIQVRNLNWPYLLFIAYSIRVVVMNKLNYKTQYM